jgi:hypothetical protein
MGREGTKAERREGYRFWHVRHMGRWGLTPAPAGPKRPASDNAGEDFRPLVDAPAPKPTEI